MKKLVVVAMAAAALAAAAMPTEEEFAKASKDVISDQSRAAWRLLSGSGLSVKDAARRLGIPANTVSKVKRRMESRIAAMLGMYDC